MRSCKHGDEGLPNGVEQWAAKKDDGDIVPCLPCEEISEVKIIRKCDQKR